MPAAAAQLEIVQEGDAYRLVFASRVDNVGPGPLLIGGERPSRDEPAMAVRQLVRRTDGTERALDVSAELRYEDAEAEGHWHLVDFTVFELRSTPDGALVRSSDAAGFCPGDRSATEGSEVEERPPQPVWTDGCGEDQPGLLSLRAGISPGYGAGYGPGLEGQSVDVTNVPAGRYLLVHRSNPRRVLEESGYDNNASSVLIQLRRSGAIPTVRVLARCPDSDTCPRGQAADRD